MALEGVDIKTLSYSSDLQRWTVRINKNVYNFYGVNPFIKKKLNQYIKHNNKKSFFEQLKALEYENITKKGEQLYSPQKKDEPENKSDDQDKKGGDGEQLSLFNENFIKHRLRQHALNS